MADMEALSNQKPHIAILGAGLSGMTLAHALKNVARVTVLEKSLQLGGRIATRKQEPFAFDHGLQCFTIRTEAFAAFLKPWFDEGYIAPWVGPVWNISVGASPSTPHIWPRLWKEKHYVFAPSMRAFCDSWSEELTILRQHTVNHIHHTHQLSSNDRLQYQLFTHEHGLLRDPNTGEPLIFDWVISTTPPEQTVNLMRRYLQKPLDTGLLKAKMHPCYSLMLGWEKPLQMPYIAAKIHNSCIKWISVDSSKPQRNSGVTSIVVHANNAWSRHHLEEDPPIVENILLSTFQQTTLLPMDNLSYKKLHRWRYAIVRKSSKEHHYHQPYLNPELQLASTGDWATSSRIEEVWFAAMDLARHIQSVIQRHPHSHFIRFPHQPLDFSASPVILN